MTQAGIPDIVMELVMTATCDLYDIDEKDRHSLKKMKSALARYCSLPKTKREMPYCSKCKSYKNTNKILCFDCHRRTDGDSYHLHYRPCKCKCIGNYDWTQCKNQCLTVTPHNIGMLCPHLSKRAINLDRITYLNPLGAAVDWLKEGITDMFVGSTRKSMETVLITSKSDGVHRLLTSLTSARNLANWGMKAIAKEICDMISNSPKTRDIRCPCNDVIIDMKDPDGVVRNCWQWSPSCRLEETQLVVGGILDTSRCIMYKKDSSQTESVLSPPNQDWVHYTFSVPADPTSHISLYI